MLCTQITIRFCVLAYGLLSLVAGTPCAPEIDAPVCTERTVLGKVAVGTLYRNITPWHEKILSAEDGYNYCCQLCKSDAGCTAVNTLWVPISANDTNCAPAQIQYYPLCQLASVVLSVTSSTSFIPERLGFENGYTTKTQVAASSTFKTLPAKCPAPTTSPACPGIIINDRALTGTLIKSIDTSQNSSLKFTDVGAGYDYCCALCSTTAGCVAWNTIWKPEPVVESECEPAGDVLQFMLCELFSWYSANDAHSPPESDFPNAYGIMLYQTPPMNEPPCQPESVVPRCLDKVVKDQQYTGTVISEVTTVGNSVIRIFTAETAYNYCCNLCFQNSECTAWNVVWVNVVGDEFGCQPLRGLYYIKCQLLSNIAGQKQSHSVLGNELPNACGKKSYSSPPPLVPQLPPPVPAPSPPAPVLSPPPPPPHKCLASKSYLRCPSKVKPNKLATGKVFSNTLSPATLRITTADQGYNWCCSTCCKAKKCKAFNIQWVLLPKGSNSCTAQQVNCTLLHSFDGASRAPTTRFKFSPAFGRAP